MSNFLAQAPIGERISSGPIVGSSELVQNSPVACLPVIVRHEHVKLARVERA